MKVVDLLSCVSSVATVLAVVIAIFALKSWRSQFKYQRKYECILDLRSQLHGANEAATYLNSLCAHFGKMIKTGVESDLFDANKFPYQLQRDWWSHLSNLQRTWALLEVTLNKRELKLFTVDPITLEDDVRNTVKEMIDLSCGEPKVSLGALYQLVSNSIVSVEEKYKILEKQCRSALIKIR
ncbi:hypothetical protein [Pseudomonas fulva]|uniref:hypothetical protein n=1 Tax=Pseudomonas fulva TaxID=47880 RepID=UPI0015E29A18|nr:hypothetical protein [Pseudomonas fulva]MBA1209452.1 hypothetical protein [Pseudomonas fulva]MDH0573640.1 hypothetical protein [Pseudomonas fulva]